MIDSQEKQHRPEVKDTDGDGESQLGETRALEEVGGSAPEKSYQAASTVTSDSEAVIGGECARGGKEAD